MMGYSTHVRRVTVALVLTLLVGLGAAHAQQQDSVLQSYTLATENLDEALVSLPTDGALSREALDRAAQTLRPLSRDVVSTSLIGALENTFTRAATAVQNQSATDLAVQTAVLRGGFQRLVYESALRAANEGDLELARERLTTLATDLGFDVTTLEAMSAADNYATLIVAFDQGVAQAVQQDLGAASEQLGTDQGGTYVSLAEAYGTFLTVQDSPRVAATANGTFVEAFRTLTSDPADTELAEGGAATEPVETLPLLLELSQTMAQFEEAARATLAGESVSLPTANENIDLATGEAAPSDATPSDSAVVTDASDTAAPEAAPLETPLETSRGTSPSVAGAEAVDDGVTLVLEPTPTDTAVNSNVATETSPAPSDALSESLNGYGLTPERQAQLAEVYRAQNVASVEGAVEALYAEGGRVLVAVETGDIGAAKTYLRAYRTTYNQLLSPLVAGRSLTVDQDTERLADSLLASPSLRLQDVAVLVGQVDSVAAALSGSAPSGAHQTLLATSLVWSGWLRTVVVLLLGVLAFVPLWLLNLAFGGANRNWRLIGVALFLLLLPIMFEGVSSLGALLSTITGVEALNILSVFSIFQNTLSQVAWVVLTALAIGLASAGLYGICVQFGLIGTPPASNDTVISTHETSMQLTGDSGVDWDEEF